MSKQVTFKCISTFCKCQVPCVYDNENGEWEREVGGTHIFLKLIPGVSLTIRIVVFLESFIGTVSKHTLHLHTHTHRVSE